MSHTVTKLFKPSVISLALFSALYQPMVAAQADANVDNNADSSVDQQIETIEVTATRRTGTAQEVPMNISALDGDVMKTQNILSQEDVARWVPGLTISDQGGREDASIIVRGLNTNTSDRIADGGTVATYIGEIALKSDIRLTDIERVEVLIGPQGTLYGAGTLGGAIRYILKDPELDYQTASISADMFSLAESGGLGHEIGAVFNTPIIEDELAFRVSINRFDTPGFIDYNYVLREPGVSNSDPDWNDSGAVQANLKQIQDANDEQIITARAALKWAPSDEFNATLNYFYQKQDSGGNSTDNYQVLSPSNPISGLIGQYENAARYEEPNTKTDKLLSLELELDLGFAELVSATGFAEYEQEGQRDQTDLLMQDIWSGYADYPAYTNDTGSSETLSQEFRLVSNSDSDLNWIVGLYYNKLESQNDDREYTPGATRDWFDGEYVNIEYDLEYIAKGWSENKESAIFGEIGYNISDDLSVIVGARFYEYDVASWSAATAPFYDGEIASTDELNYEKVSASDNGSLFKLNTSYQISKEVLGYFTVSEGFRLGGGNGLVACTNPLTTQVCALPNEIDYKPDTTTNTELGLKSSWFKNKLHLNAAIFSVDWDNAQIGAASVNGAELITLNAGKANSTGLELSGRTTLIQDWAIFASYSYAKAELTEDAPFLFGVIDDQGTALQDYYDGKDGDRLPGAPQQQFSLGISYNTEILGDKPLSINYGLTAQDEVITKVGLRADGETLPGYALSNLSATLNMDSWSVTAYVDNLFNKYAYTSVRRDKSWVGMAQFESQNKDLAELGRVYGHYVTKPRTIGVRINYEFGL